MSDTAPPSLPLDTPDTVAPAGGHLSIGEVLALLLEEFPDVTISKIRFLESQGLIDPERTASGYRKFYRGDVELLRCILREQRENYLPLRVIKDRIDSGEIDPTNENLRPRGIKNVTDPRDAADVPDPSGHPSAGGVTGAAALFARTDGHADAAAAARAAQPPADADGAHEADSEVRTDSANGAGGEPDTDHDRGASRSLAPSAPSDAPPEAPEPPPDLTGVLLTADELCAMTGLTRAELADLESYGVLSVDSSAGDSWYDEDAAEIAGLAKRFIDAGIDARHLRGWRVSADREVGLLEQLIQPLLRQRNPQARAHAVDQLHELEQVGGKLRAAMMRSSLRHHTSR
jgi:DNA-binding transcriptional MerR regulator